MSMQIEDTPFCQFTKFEGKKIHLGISGSIACYKAADLLRALLKTGIKVSATLTSGCQEFISPLLIRALGANPVYGKMFEGDIFGHLEPGQQADGMVVAPASADIIAQMANGRADDMLSAQYVAFGKKCVVAPAMNPTMWKHAATQANVAALAQQGCMIVEPGTGGTACGDEGKGRLAELPEIFLASLKAIAPQDMAGKKVMLTLGPTREPWDGVRFWTNYSSGKMGAALATAAWMRGAEATAICGPVSNIYLPRDIKRENVVSAKEMFQAASQIWPHMDIGIFNSAVSDFAPARPEQGQNFKFKKNGADSGITIKFQRNPDILATLSCNKAPNQKTLGFAAEITPDMEALIPLAKGKLNAKNANIIAANRVNSGGGAFGAEKASMCVVDANGREEIWPAQEKADIAWELLSWLLNM